MLISSASKSILTITDGEFNLEWSTKLQLVMPHYGQLLHSIKSCPGESDICSQDDSVDPDQLREII